MKYLGAMGEAQFIAEHCNLGSLRLEIEARQRGEEYNRFLGTIPLELLERVYEARMAYLVPYIEEAWKNEYQRDNQQA